jgi:hypothetical protein
VLTAIIRISRQASRNDAIECAWQGGFYLRRHRARLGENGSDERRRGRTAEGGLSCGYLKHHGTERKDIGPRIHWFSFELFGSHVGNGSDQRSLDRPESGAGGVKGCCRILSANLALLGYAEVEQLEPASSQHDVRRLEISVDDAFAMGRFERFGNGDGDRKELRRWDRTSS